MNCTAYWLDHYQRNAQVHRVDWSISPCITEKELITILPSLQAWQLGETSDGSNLLRAAEKYASVIRDPLYVEVVRLFIREEQKHGDHLGRYLDLIGQQRISRNWGDSLFRWIRHLNTSMEMWTLAVIVVESTAQLFYQSLKDATDCPMLKQICTDILIDEAHHIRFQSERMQEICQRISSTGKWWRRWMYPAFFACTALTVWVTHRKVFLAGGNNFSGYCDKMALKYRKTLRNVTDPVPVFPAGLHNNI